jgi:hypothetical protein
MSKVWIAPIGTDPPEWEPIGVLNEPFGTTFSMPENSLFEPYSPGTSLTGGTVTASFTLTPEATANIYHWCRMEEIKQKMRRDLKWTLYDFANRWGIEYP